MSKNFDSPIEVGFCGAVPEPSFDERARDLAASSQTSLDGQGAHIKWSELTLAKRVIIAEEKLSRLPGDWFEDSSLETWFPLTAKEFDRLKLEIKQLNETIEFKNHADTLPDRVEWHSARTVGHLVQQLRTIDPEVAISTAIFIDRPSGIQARCHGTSMSWERVIKGGWIDSSREDVPRSIVIWQASNHPDSTELDSLAHEIALEDVRSVLECEALMETEDGIEWWDMSHASQPADTDKARRYLELRGLLIKHPTKPNWIRVKEASE